MPEKKSLSSKEHLLRKIYNFDFKNDTIDRKILLNLTGRRNKKDSFADDEWSSDKKRDSALERREKSVCLSVSEYNSIYQINKSYDSPDTTLER